MNRLKSTIMDTDEIESRTPVAWESIPVTPCNNQETKSTIKHQKVKKDDVLK